jgi:hypothetical protein
LSVSRLLELLAIFFCLFLLYFLCLPLRSHDLFLACADHLIVKHRFVNDAGLGAWSEHAIMSPDHGHFEDDLPHSTSSSSSMSSETQLILTGVLVPVVALVVVIFVVIVARTKNSNKFVPPPIDVVRLCRPFILPLCLLLRLLFWSHTLACRRGSFRARGCSERGRWVKGCLPPCFWRC